MENKDKNLAWAGKNHNKKSKGGVTKTEKRCVLPQITIDKLQDVLAQMTRNIFFYEMTKTKMRCVLAQITSNKVEKCVTTNHKRQFFSMKGQG